MTDNITILDSAEVEKTIATREVAGVHTNKHLLVDADGQAVQIDGVSGALTTVASEHHEMHEGDAYFIRTWADVTGAGTIQYFMFRTPAGPARVHARVGLAASDEFRVEIYEDGTVSADGGGMGYVNCDRDSANVAGLVATGAPTVTTDGNLIWDARVGVGKTAGVNVGMNYEIIAKVDAIYLFKVTKISAGTHYIDVDFFWYEHTPSS